MSSVEDRYIAIWKPWYEKYVYTKFPACKSCKIWLGTIKASNKMLGMHMWHIDNVLAQRLFETGEFNASV